MISKNGIRFFPEKVSIIANEPRIKRFVNLLWFWRMFCYLVCLFLDFVPNMNFQFLSFFISSLSFKPMKLIGQNYYIYFVFLAPNIISFREITKKTAWKWDLFFVLQWWCSIWFGGGWCQSQIHLFHLYEKNKKIELSDRVQYKLQWESDREQKARSRWKIEFGAFLVWRGKFPWTLRRTKKWYLTKKISRNCVILAYHT